MTLKELKKKVESVAEQEKSKLRKKPKYEVFDVSYKTKKGNQNRSSV